MHLFDETAQDLMFQIHIPIKYLNIKMSMKNQNLMEKYHVIRLILIGLGTTQYDRI